MVQIARLEFVTQERPELERLEPPVAAVELDRR
jgi:hypothetical protein